MDGNGSFLDSNFSSADLQNKLDLVSLAEINCYLTVVDTIHFRNGSGKFCNTTWDGVSCWPATNSGEIAQVACFSELKGVQYDINDNVTRECLENGTWSNWSNYRSCKPLPLPDHELVQGLWNMKEASTVYFVGYGISLIALSLALWVFLHFKDLRCLRNSIHTNLMLTYFLIDFTWMLTAILQSNQNSIASRLSCFLVILLTYLLGTNFFWMFVEGLYLFILVVKTFSVDSVKIQIYALIGWGVPAIVATIWAAAKAQWGSITDPLSSTVCPWQNRDYFDYIFISPVITVLVVNIIFLAIIMYVLITKLRASNTVESEQYRKAAKALLVLIPLLGVTYILVIATPSDPTAEVVFTYIQACLLSIQGFIVAVLYCFLNGEVQNSVRHHLERWRLRQAINKGQHHSLGGQASSNPSDCFKLYGGRGVRESCASFTTSTSFVNFNSIVRSPSSLNNDAQIEFPINHDNVLK